MKYGYFVHKSRKRKVQCCTETVYNVKLKCTDLFTRAHIFLNAAMLLCSSHMQCALLINQASITEFGLMNTSEKPINTALDFKYWALFCDFETGRPRKY